MKTLRKSKTYFLNFSGYVLVPSHDWLRCFSLYANSHPLFIIRCSVLVFVDEFWSVDSSYVSNKRILGYINMPMIKKTHVQCNGELHT